jgi:pimeloyl-ACP methyl ester carboxylesterase
LPAGATTRDMVGDYARWAQGKFDGPVDVIGFSTGGEIAQHFAADHGQLVGRLVLSDTGCRLMKEPGDASDYIATLAADLAHDATDALPTINAPTLVIAGTP